MPRLKTNKSAVKRFRPTASGGFKHRSALRNHILTKKSSKRKSKLALMGQVDQSDVAAVKTLFRVL